MVGDHYPELHFAIKLSTRAADVSDAYQAKIEGSMEDMRETLAVLDAFQCFFFGKTYERFIFHQIMQSKYALNHEDDYVLPYRYSSDGIDVADANRFSQTNSGPVRILEKI